MIRVGLVDDDQEHCELLRSYLARYEQEGGVRFRTEVFLDGLSFVEDYDGSLDIVFLDIEMPHMDGMTAARLIRELDDPVLARTPIVALSANSQEQDIRRSMDCGMDGHLPKPISIPQLLEKIRQAAGRGEPDKNS